MIDLKVNADEARHIRDTLGVGLSEAVEIVRRKNRKAAIQELIERVERCSGQNRRIQSGTS